MSVRAAPLGAKVLEALGLPTQRCLSVKLEFEPDSIVTATVVYAPDEENVQGMVDILRVARLTAADASKGEPSEDA